MTGQGKNGLKGAALRHFRHTIWTKDSESAGGVRKGFFALSRLIYMVSTGFLADHCIIRASALTFTTILSIVPLLAVAFSISKGFGLQNAEFFRNFLMGIAADRAEVVNKILQYIANTNVKTLGWIGVGALLLTVYTTVSNVERAFNNIWNIKRGRTSWRKFTDFFSVIVICPIIVLVAASVTVAVQKLDLVQDFFASPGSQALEKFLLKLLSLVLVWVGFVFVYAFVPNTRVRLRSAVAGGLVAGTLWQSAQWLYIHWQIGFTKYNAIYGSFAQLPLFLVWLYISWVIVLLGAEVSYAVQNLGGFVRRGLSERLSPVARQKVAVAALTHIAARFAAGLSPLSVRELSKALHLPEDVVLDTFAILTARGMAVPLGDEDAPGFGLAVAADNIRMAEVLEALVDCGEDGECGAMVLHPGVEPLFQTFAEAQRQSAANVTLEEFARAEAAELRTDAARARELEAIRERAAQKS
ncbi:MAG: YhjD/YihY/BrkB family envelope integrity protein [Desulfovibrio sp.]